MKRALILLAIAAVLGIALVIALMNDGLPAAPTSGTYSTSTPDAAPVTSSSASACHARGVLPDPVCTPGAFNPNVTQSNIGQTICVTGWSATVRPPVSYTNQLKVQSIAAYGYTDTDPSHYEMDHEVPLSIGGSPTDPKNLWAEPGASPNAKDKIEWALHDAVCAGKLQLSDAQQRIRTDWTTAMKGVN